MKKRWIISIFITVLFTVFTINKWISVDKEYEPSNDELTTQEQALKFTEDHFSALNEDKEVLYSKIGIYVDSLQFQSSNDVLLSGYIWQKSDQEQAKLTEPGVIFPESIGGVTFDEAYTKEENGETTIGWYFETNLRQHFDYSKYPLDHKTVWIKIWPKDFNDEIVLLPDINSYNSTKYDDLFGISSSIVLNGWNISDTYFSYNISSYDTDFGLGSDFVRSQSPDLYYNIVLQRDFSKAFLTNLTLILVIMILLFGVLLLLTADKDKMEGSFGMSVNGVIGTASGLFFSVLLAHINLRSMFNGGIVYMEYFYYLAYAFIVIVTALIYYYMKEVTNQNHKLIKSEANWIKVLYWPVYMGIMLLLTLLFL